MNKTVRQKEQNLLNPYLDVKGKTNGRPDKHFAIVVTYKAYTVFTKNIF